MILGTFSDSEEKNNTHTHTQFPKILAFNLKRVFLHTFSFTMYLGTFPVIQFVSATRGVGGRELVSKVTTDSKVPSLGGWGAHPGGDPPGNADLPAVGGKVRSPFSTKCLEIFPSDKGAGFWGSRHKGQQN